jgi:hypothetical protein
VAEEHVLDDVQVLAEREVLVNDLDTQRTCLARIMNIYGLAEKLYDAIVEGLDARETLDQRGLASTVVSDQGCDATWINLEINSL